MQYELLRELVGGRAMFTAVGDDDQSIYGWRGATLDNLKRLAEDFPALQVIPLVDANAPAPTAPHTGTGLASGGSNNIAFLPFVAVGLAIVVVYYRNRGSIAVEDINMMKG